MEYITWETFLLKNHPQNVAKKLFLGPFLKYLNWAYLWIDGLKFYPICFFIVCQVNGYQNILKLRSRPLAFILYKDFLKIKKIPTISLPRSLSAWFLEKEVSFVISY